MYSIYLQGDKKKTFLQQKKQNKTILHYITSYKNAFTLKRHNQRNCVKR